MQAAQQEYNFKMLCFSLDLIAINLASRFALRLSDSNKVETATVNFANNDCGYNGNPRITTEFPCPEQSPFYLYAYIETSGITTLF